MPVKFKFLTFSCLRLYANFPINAISHSHVCSLLLYLIAFAIPQEFLDKEFRIAKKNVPKILEVSRSISLGEKETYNIKENKRNPRNLEVLQTANCQRSCQLYRKAYFMHRRLFNIKNV